ncbi:MAG: hypothetical protein ACREDW_07700 [Aestuariivirgaceae bacterium]
MTDVILKLIALVGFVLTLAVLAIYVPQADLIGVLTIVVLMAAYDFLLRPIIRSRRST